LTKPGQGVILNPGPETGTVSESSDKHREGYMAHRLAMNGDEPFVDQGRENGWHMSWNPDNNRFCVCAKDDGVATATFKDWRNAVQYARRHKKPA
jgi:hypothetical protein